MNFVDPDGRVPVVVIPAVPFIVEGLKDLIFVATAAWTVYNMNMFRRNPDIILNMEINKEEGIEPKESWTEPN